MFELSAERQAGQDLLLEQIVFRVQIEDGAAIDVAEPVQVTGIILVAAEGVSDRGPQLERPVIEEEDAGAAHRTQEEPLLVFDFQHGERAELVFVRAFVFRAIEPQGPDPKNPVAFRRIGTAWRRFAVLRQGLVAMRPHQKHHGGNRRHLVSAHTIESAIVSTIP